MAGKPKGEIMTRDEMIELGMKKRTESRIYKGEAMQLNDNAISTIVNRGLAEIINADRQKIDMSDSEMVKTVSKAYIQACADTATLPSIAGLARAMGVNRHTLYHWMKQKNTETGRWLLMCQDLFSDLLADGALKNNINPIVSIFLQKAQFGLHENAPYVIRLQDNDYDISGSGYKEKYQKFIGSQE